MPDNHKPFNERNLDFWRARTSQALTNEDAREMAANVSGFFRLLAEWDRNARREEAPSQLSPSAADSAGTPADSLVTLSDCPEAPGDSEPSEQ